MRILVSLILVFSSTSAFAFYGRGGMVGNGGDLIKCEKSSLNSLNGYYTLDYVASYASSSKPIPESTDPLKDIVMSMWNRRANADGSPNNMRYLSLSLASFAESAHLQMFSEPNYVFSNIWISESLGLLDIQDEELIQKIPDNCKSGTELSVTQAVIRRPSGQSTIYHFDNTVWPKLTSPYQNSYLIIHEWLRGITEDAQVIRDTNRLLHSTAFRDASGEDALLMFKNVSGFEGGPDVDQRYFASYRYSRKVDEGLKEIAVPFFIGVTIDVVGAPPPGDRQFGSNCLIWPDTQPAPEPDDVSTNSCNPRAGLQMVSGQTLYYYGPRSAKPVALAHVTTSQLDFTFK